VQVGEGLEGEGLERVAGEDGCGLAKGHMTSRLAAAEVVVVECGQVVVDKRIGVDHLDRCAEFGRGGVERAATGDHAGSFDGEDRAQAFAAGEGAVAHGAMDGVGRGVSAGKKALDGLIGERGAGLEEGLDVGIHRSWMIVDGGTTVPKGK